MKTLYEVTWFSNTTQTMRTVVMSDKIEAEQFARKGNGTVKEIRK